MKYTKLSVAIFFSSMLLLSGCGSNDSKDATPPPATENPTPPADTPASSPDTPQALASTTIVTTAGQSIQVDKTASGFVFHGYEGKIVLLEVYGDTCPHCVAAIPSYNALQAKYPNDVVVIALESYGTLTHAAEQQYITVPKANTGSMFSFITELTGNSLGAVPYLMMFNREGVLFYDKVLADFPANEIDAQIKNFL